MVGDEPADVLYKVDASYNPAGEGGISWNDAELAIPWPLSKPTVSKRDQGLHSFAQYRAKPPAGADLGGYPKYLLMSKPQTTDWHEFGMEWKEHVAWFAPILATAVAFAVARWPRRVLRDGQVRLALSMLLTGCFFCASVAGLLGALINKAAPTR